MRGRSILAASIWCFTSVIATELHAQVAMKANEAFPAAQISKLDANIVKAFNVFMTYKATFSAEGYSTGTLLSASQASPNSVFHWWPPMRPAGTK
jgi:hypothetical protein